MSGWWEGKDSTDFDPPIGHVFPLEDESHEHLHSFEGVDCPCKPKISQVCPVCSMTEEDASGCGFCEDGWVDRQWGDPNEVPTIVTHNQIGSEGDDAQNCREMPDL